MKNKNIHFPIETLIDYCKGALDSETELLVAQAIENNELLKEFIKVLKQQPSIAKNELKEQIDLSMNTLLDSKLFADSFAIAPSSNVSSPNASDVRTQFKNKKKIRWILGVIILGLIGLLSYQSPNSPLNLLSEIRGITPTYLQADFKLSGTVQEGKGAYAVLMYMPRMRGNLNYDGFKNMGTWIDGKGDFTLSAAQMTHGGNYTLKINDHFTHFIGFRGDDINLEIDLADTSNTVFATGRGAGKVNVLQLPQFAYIPYDYTWSMEFFKSQVDSVLTAQMSLLEAIYTQEASHIAISETPNSAQIRRIIEESPLSKAEYEFLKVRIRAYQTTIVDYLLRLDEGQKTDSLQIDLNDSGFDYFKPETYQGINHINDWYLGNTLDKILYLEFLRDKYGPNQKISLQDWQSAQTDPAFSGWVNKFLKVNFSEAVRNKYHADIFAMNMTLGRCTQEQLDHLKAECKNDQYLKRITEYHDLIDYGLEDTTYQLGSEALILNDQKFKELLELYKGKPLYLVFWSAKFAGSMIISNLPEIKAFEQKNQGELKVIYICIDQAKHKNLWATRIIDNSWKSDHYFMPVEGNDSTLNQFSSKKIASFCYGGATYAFINKAGVIDTKIKSPMDLVSEDFRRYLK